jgi:hypothetical protein
MTADLHDALRRPAPSDVRRTSPPRRRRTRAAGAVLAAAALGLTGCAAGGAASDAALASNPAVAPGVDGVVAQPGTALVERGAPATAAGTAGGQKDSAPSSDLAVATTRSVVVTADQSVRVGDVPKATDQLDVLAARYRATIDTQVTSQGDGPIATPAATKDACVQGACPSPVPSGYASSTTTLRVDNSKVDALLRDTATLGSVESSSRSSADVTAEVADVDSRVANAEASLARVRLLMSKATTIGDVVALEAELSRRQADLEALQARQRTLADQTAAATVTVRLFDDNAPVVTPEDGSGFVAGLKAGWTAFTGALVAAMTVVGAVLPFAIVLVPLALLARAAWRRRQPAATASEPVVVEST